MICPHCGTTEGHYDEYEDYTWEWELHSYTRYYCYGCKETTEQCADGFVWGDEL